MSKIDPNCICYGNWRNIIRRYEECLGNNYINLYTDTLHKFIGIMHGDDDYYYVMYNYKTKQSHFLSCVGWMSDHGYVQVSDE